MDAARVASAMAVEIITLVVSLVVQVSSKSTTRMLGRCGVSVEVVDAEMVLVQRRAREDDADRDLMGKFIKSVDQIESFPRILRGKEITMCYLVMAINNFCSRGVVIFTCHSASAIFKPIKHPILLVVNYTPDKTMASKAPDDERQPASPITLSDLPQPVLEKVFWLAMKSQK